MLYSFGGASAIGKTTLCQSFSDDYYIVPEVNLLFAQEKRTSPLWYYEKQVERFSLAKSATQDAIFDGDIFQPIWYNWIYGYPVEFASKAATHEFYLQQIQAGQIAFPDLYFIFYADMEALKKRKENDPTRSRRNFEKHLQLIKPHRKYFEFVQRETAIQVEFVEYLDMETTKKKVEALIQKCSPKNINTADNFNMIIKWLSKEDPFI